MAFVLKLPDSRRMSARESSTRTTTHLVTVGFLLETTLNMTVEMYHNQMARIAQTIAAGALAAYEQQGEKKPTLLPQKAS